MACHLCSRKEKVPFFAWWSAQARVISIPFPFLSTINLSLVSLLSSPILIPPKLSPTCKPNFLLAAGSSSLPPPPTFDITTRPPMQKQPFSHQFILPPQSPSAIPIVAPDAAASTSSQTDTVNKPASKPKGRPLTLLICQLYWHWTWIANINAKRLCRNVIIHGFCKFEDKGCEFNHEVVVCCGSVGGIYRKNPRQDNSIPSVGHQTIIPT